MEGQDNDVDSSVVIRLAHRTDEREHVARGPSGVEVLLAACK
ncbi:hypothetical protein PC116_g2970 [Phytophthora cactorum]|uniref:Uncharacterized protein n=1 Tax=Phytophthora cactorum TaxID=29920 RepID=A0A8T1DGM2_9STRA|nr:hypothetical protein PC114_g11060 [Phytophthora cactorum]KAG2939896.1 hypothetical protein PC117_g10773 [Phytophthora cactorum]KAG2979797.1 hypothetical protein PC119_g21386 [Phytophthora cactorum]KAG2999102.1 hypothetical protein PC120_g20994 [Phytophthora cactorum]KAG3187901.1 hypothetical protein PC128_g12401 [Phytophthora cactorum]